MQTMSRKIPDIDAWWDKNVDNKYAIDIGHKSDDVEVDENDFKSDIAPECPRAAHVDTFTNLLANDSMAAQQFIRERSNDTPSYLISFFRSALVQNNFSFAAWMLSEFVFDGVVDALINFKNDKMLRQYLDANPKVILTALQYAKTFDIFDECYLRKLYEDRRIVVELNNVAIAIFRGYVNLARQMLNRPEMNSADHNQCVMWAVRSGEIAFAKEIMAKLGYIIDETCSRFIVYHRDMDLIKWLREHNMDVTVDTDDLPLLIAEGHSSFVRQLIEYLDVKDLVGVYIRAISRDEIEFAQWLIGTKRHSIDYKDVELTISRNQTQFLQWLIRGQYFTVTESHAIHAVIGGKFIAATMLLEKLTNVSNKIAEYAISARTTSSGHAKFAQWIIENGHWRDAERLCEFAIRDNYIDVAKQLLETKKASITQCMIEIAIARQRFEFLKWEFDTTRLIAAASLVDVARRLNADFDQYVQSKMRAARECKKE